MSIFVTVPPSDISNCACSQLQAAASLSITTGTVTFVGGSGLLAMCGGGDDIDEGPIPTIKELLLVDEMAKTEATICYYLQAKWLSFLSKYLQMKSIGIRSHNYLLKALARF